ncbi:transposase, partial [Escherichia coli]
SFICTACGYTANADVNGARNILTAGFEVMAAGQILPSVRKGRARKAA